MTLLFCHVGWMERYQGLQSGDTIKGGGEYVADNDTGHEVCNFAAVGSRLFGYVQARSIDIDRLGASGGDESVSGITVIWTARRPKGRTVVVGWYRDATVYRNDQRFNPSPKLQAANGIHSYLIAAPVARATLLPLDARVLVVPRKVIGGMGRSAVWYADAPQMASFRTKVGRLLTLGTVALPKSKNPSGKPDQARKLLVEKAAIKMCWKHYKRLGYALRSVEKDNVGWDLEATRDSARLRIEVKGLSGKGKQIELSPNEYVAFQRHDDHYRLAVVSDALGSPVLSIARFSEAVDDWVIEDDAELGLVFQERVAATVRIH